MRLPRLLLPIVSAFASSAVATNLFVASYAGTVTTLQLLQNSSNGSDSLKTLFVSNITTTNPSWLTFDAANQVLYSLSEGGSTQSSITSFKVSASGVLTTIDNHIIISGGVASKVYNGGKAIAVAHYGGSSLTSWTIQPSGGLKALNSFTFKMSAPGPNTTRQDAPHPHEALIDPTDRFVIVPDLGADLVRVFRIDPKTSNLTESTPLKAAPGSGPRHGAFRNLGGVTYFYLVSELASSVTAYTVTYGTDSLTFTLLQSQGIFGPSAIPSGSAAAEAVLSPDQKFLMTSNRGAAVFNITNFDPKINKELPSDAVEAWAIDDVTGKLKFVQNAPAGGIEPRQFSVNKAGTLVAVGLQGSSRVVVINRNVVDGTFGEFVAESNIAGEVSCVIFDE